MINFPNDRIDKYQIIEPLGEGGMGFVFKATPLDSDNEVALKCCKFSDETSIRRFKREVRAIRGVDHKNVMRILDMNLDFDPPYYTMPLADCSTFDILDH